MYMPRHFGQLCTASVTADVRKAIKSMKGSFHETGTFAAQHVRTEMNKDVAGGDDMKKRAGSFY